MKTICVLLVLLTSSFSYGAILSTTVKNDVGGYNDKGRKADCEDIKVKVEIVNDILLKEGVLTPGNIIKMNSCEHSHSTPRWRRILDGPQPQEYEVEFELGHEDSDINCNSKGRYVVFTSASELHDRVGLWVINSLFGKTYKDRLGNNTYLKESFGDIYTRPKPISGREKITIAIKSCLLN